MSRISSCFIRYIDISVGENFNLLIHSNFQKETERERERERESCQILN